MTVSPRSTSPQVELSANKQELLRRRLRRGNAAAPSIPRRPADAGPPPLSYAQERLWFMEQFAPGTGAYTVPLSLRMRGTLDAAALTRALTEVTVRHECLRSRFRTTEHGAASVVIEDPADVDVHVVDVSDEDASTRERRAREVISAEVTKPFDLGRDPLLRATLVRLAADDHVLLVATHHIVSDGWSTEIIADEVLTLYEGYARGSSPALPELELQYADYAEWHREQASAGALHASREYWRGQLADVSPLDLPVDGVRGAELTYAGASHHFQLPRPVVDALRELAGSAGSTLHLAVLAGFQLLLSRHTGQHTFAVGSPIAGRQLPELERLVGFFVNMLPIRAEVSDNPRFADLLARTQDTALEAWSHQDLPFERLVQELDVAREPSRSPVFQTVFVMHDYLRPGSWAADRRAADLSVHRFPFDSRTTRFDLELYAFESPHGLECMFVYNSDLFAPERIERMSGHLDTLLRSAVEQPDTPVGQLDMLTPAELAAIRRWNDTAMDLGEPTCLHRMVLEQARRTPDAVAVRDASGSMTYGELGRGARVLAGELSAVQRGELVAVVLERGVEQVIATVAVQLSGAAYLPVDPDLPDERRQQLLRLGRCRVAITQSRLANRLTWPDGLHVVAADSPPQVTANLSDGPATPEDLAYVIYTSGSTGQPKGVVIDHRGAVNTVRDINARFGIGPSDRVLAVSALSFDLSVQDIFGTLGTGGTLLIPEQAAAKDPAEWARWVERERVTVWTSAPALMELLLEHAEAEGTDISSLRLIMLSGDWIPLDIPRRLWALAPEAKLVSQGGATEASIWSCFYEVDRVDEQWRSIPYGRPLWNQSMYVLDQHGGHVPVGVTGELHIGGVGVAVGYWDEPDRTDASFHVHDGIGNRLYRTGDLCQYGPDGVLEILGRVDFQVKIRGYRIELGEIEAHLNRCPGVAECVVMVRQVDGDRVLVGYIVLSDGQAGSAPTDLRSSLARQLPAYMVPNHYVVVPGLPLNTNGKVDRSRLPDPAASTATSVVSRPPRTVTERTVAAVWADVLSVPTVGIDDDFFDLGGHSLAAIQAVTRLRRRVSGGTGTGPAPAAQFGVAALFRHPTVRELAAFIDRPAGSAQADGSRRVLHELTPPERAATRAVSFVCVPYGGGQPMVYQ
ncbi:MAG: non-ribosomal peptide synthetase, partial [Thermocrispum sp.]